MERSNPLHNFSLPLAWGKHKLFECRNVYENESDGADEFNENPLAKNCDKRLGKQSSDDPHEIWVTREKPMGEYKSKIGKMKETNMKIGECGGSGVGVGAGADMEIDDPPSDKKTMRPRRHLDKKEERPRFSLSFRAIELWIDLFA
ncbi:hypothetical protein Tco_0860014 [Tanacetum coccineum]|uniref:Uncharacterized protein n=1 Tax=Tanacetum coccineum TaxID=301880 RepID=A0ABQ5BGV5_9ASTR